MQIILEFLVRKDIKFIYRGSRRNKCFEGIIVIIYIIESLLSGRFSFRRSAAVISAGGLIKLFAQILPVVDHDLLDGQQGLVADVRVLVDQMLHHHLLSSQFVNHVLTAGVMPERESQSLLQRWNNSTVALTHLPSYILSTAVFTDLTYRNAQITRCPLLDNVALTTTTMMVMVMLEMLI